MELLNLTENKLDLIFRVSNDCATFHQDRLKTATIGATADNRHAD